MLELTEQVVGRLRATPGDFASPAAVAQAARVSLKLLDGLCVTHYHAGLAELLLRARRDAARAGLLRGRGSVAAVARAVGYESETELRRDFALRLGLSPEAFRHLRAREEFELTLPEDFPLEALRQALGRDPLSLTERLKGDDYSLVLRLEEGPQVVHWQFVGDQLGVSAPGTARAGMVEIYAVVLRMLGLEQDLAGWLKRARRRGLSRLVAACPGLRTFQTPSVYEGLLLTIIGQQINLAFAFALRERLVRLCGTELGEGLWAAPAPEAVAALEPGQLLALQFSRQKADFLISISRLIAAGELPLEGLRAASATRAEATLLAVRGLGRWSVNYLMMRSLGFADCLPLGDTGVTSALWSLFGTAQRPGPEETLALMEPLRPYRSLATAQLWRWGR